MYLNASDTQYEMKLVTPHFRAWRGTGSRSLFVLFRHQLLQPFLSSRQTSLPSRIPFCERRLWLFNLPRKMGFLNDRHVEPQPPCDGIERRSLPQFSRVVHGDLRLFIHVLILGVISSRHVVCIVAKCRTKISHARSGLRSLSLVNYRASTTRNP